MFVLLSPMANAGSQILNCSIGEQYITLQGSVQADGSYALALYDTDRVLQLGFGVRFECIQ
jgi:hypothetical protein